MLLQTNMRKTTKTLAGHSLLDAVNFYMRHRANGVAGRNGAPDAIEDFRQAGLSGQGGAPYYLKDIRYRLGGFAKAFNLEVRELAAQDVADYLEELKLHSRSLDKGPFSRCCGRSFASVRQEDGFQRTSTLLSRVERRSGSGSGLWIFTPEELRRLLAAASSRIVTCLGVQAFAGVRTRGTLSAHVARFQTRYLATSRSEQSRQRLRRVSFIPIFGESSPLGLE